jgi:hypothetical protein
VAGGGAEGTIVGASVGSAIVGVTATVVGTVVAGKSASCAAAVDVCWRCSVRWRAGGLGVEEIADDAQSAAAEQQRDEADKDLAGDPRVP